MCIPYSSDTRGRCRSPNAPATAFPPPPPCPRPVPLGVWEVPFVQGLHLVLETRELRGGRGGCGLDLGLGLAPGPGVHPALAPLGPWELWAWTAGVSWAPGPEAAAPNSQERGSSTCGWGSRSPRVPPSQGPGLPAAPPAAAASALSPVAAREPAPGAAPAAGSVWCAHSAACAPAGTPPRPAAPPPWPGREWARLAVTAVETEAEAAAAVWSSRPSVPRRAHHCSSWFQRLAVSCSGTEAVDGGWLDSYLSESSSRLKVSGLVRSPARRSPRSSRVMALSWEGPDAPEGPLSAGSARRRLGSSPLGVRLPLELTGTGPQTPAGPLPTTQSSTRLPGSHRIQRGLAQTSPGPCLKTHSTPPGQRVGARGQKQSGPHPHTCGRPLPGPAPLLRPQLRLT